MQAVAARLARPVLACADRPEGLRAMPVRTGPSGGPDRAQFSPLEALGRLLCGLAPWLELESAAAPGGWTAELDAVHRLIEISCAPTGPAALNFSHGHQPLVDAAFLAQGVLRAPTALWEKLPEPGRANLVQALRSTREIKAHFNNWLLFAATIEAMFCRLGLPWDRARVDYALRQHEQWYRGDGFYSDGPHLRLDYYNSYVIQPMLTDILTAVAGTYREWDDMARRVEKRMARLAEILERLIGPDGGFPPLGRSITYRCAAFQPLAQLALKGSLPDSLPRGQVREALIAVVERTLGSSGNFDEDGWLQIGLNAHQPDLAEHYICTGSLYLCSTALLPLGLAEGDPFWRDAALPWTQIRLWSRNESLIADVSLDKA